MNFTFRVFIIGELNAKVRQYSKRELGLVVLSASTARFTFSFIEFGYREISFVSGWEFRIISFWLTCILYAVGSLIDGGMDLSVPSARSEKAGLKIVSGGMGRYLLVAGTECNWFECSNFKNGAPRTLTMTCRNS